MQTCHRRYRAVGRILFVLLLVGTTMRPAQGQTFSLLHSFYGPEGASPRAALIQGKDGALYGTTSKGGARDGGTVFKLNPDGTGFQTLHSFSGSGFNDGAYPYSALFQGKDGALYGTTAAGGARDRGTVFRLAILAP